MTCSYCLFVNVSNALYCGACGRSLVFAAVCSACQSQNPDENAYCDQCAAPLGDGIRLGTTPATARNVQRTARRLNGIRNIRLPRPKLPRPGLVWSIPDVQPWHRWEIAFLIVLTLVAAALRLYRVTELPDGLHGDEAILGLDAVRVMREGLIGPYVASALGQPTGPIYWTALVFALSDVSRLALHVSMSILGIVTIPAAYLLFRLAFGRSVAGIAVVMLTFSYWHIFFSRSAFMLISMPLLTTVAAALFLAAVRSRNRWLWFGAGGALGVGVYTYNAYPVFLAAVVAVLAVVLILGRDRGRRYLVFALVLGVGAFITAYPLIRYVYADPDRYFQHHRTVSVLREPKYQAAGSLREKARYLSGRAIGAALIPFRHDRIDYSDGLGGRGLMHPLIGLLAYYGLGLAFRRWRDPAHLLTALSVVLGLSVVVFGSEDWGELRRPLVAVPFVYGLAGIAAVHSVQWAASRVRARGGPRRAAYAVAAVILAVVCLANTVTYFHKIARADHLNWVYVTDLVDALDAAHVNGDPGKVYFYSDRWSYDYETRRFLYPDTAGIDRSREFGEYTLARRDHGAITYVLLAPYTNEREALTSLYPGGVLTEDSGERFVIYHLP